MEPDATEPDPTPTPQANLTIIDGDLTHVTYQEVRYIPWGEPLRFTATDRVHIAAFEQPDPEGRLLPRLRVSKNRSAARGETAVYLSEPEVEPVVVLPLGQEEPVGVLRTAPVGFPGQGEL